MADVFPAPPEGCPAGYTYQPPAPSGLFLGGLRPVATGLGRATCFRSEEGSFLEELAEGFAEFPEAIQRPEFQVGFLQTAAFAASAVASGGVAPFLSVGQEVFDLELDPASRAAITFVAQGVPMANGFDFSSFLPDLDYGGILQQGITQIGLPLLAQELIGGTALAARPPTGGLPAPRAPVSVVPSGMGLMMGRFASRFPNLAGALTVLRIGRSKAWSLLRQLGPAGLIGLGFTAEAINELMVAGPGRRRMNPLNPRALSRATRRLCSFQRRSSAVMSALAPLVRRSSRKRGRCAVCRKTPCRC